MALLVPHFSQYEILGKALADILPDRSDLVPTRDGQLTDAL